MKTLKELKTEGAPPKMKPNGTHPGDSFIYVPVNEAYFDWYWEQQKNRDLAKPSTIRREL